MLRLLAGVADPDEGEVQLDGVPLSSRRRERKSQIARIAWLPQDDNIVPGLTVTEHVAFSAWLKGKSKADALSASGPAIDRVRLSNLRNARADRLSGGQKRRLGIAGALAHGATVILLDEPTAGLDPIQRKSFRETVSELASEACVVVSSHDTGDVYGQFNDAIVLDRGEVRFNGTVVELMGEASPSLHSRDRVEAAYMRLVTDE